MCVAGARCAEARRNLRSGEDHRLLMRDILANTERSGVDHRHLEHGRHSCESRNGYRRHVDVTEYSESLTLFFLASVSAAAGLVTLDQVFSLPSGYTLEKRDLPAELRRVMLSHRHSVCVVVTQADAGVKKGLTVLTG